MSVREQLDSIAHKRVLILDGAMGSIIQARGLSESGFRGSEFADHPAPLKGCNDLLCRTKPEVIGEIHDAYLEAGADIIETCSFNSTAVSLSGYGLGHLAYEISRAAAEVARNSADKFSVPEKPRFVAGSIGPTARGASLYPDMYDPSRHSIDWDELEAAYYDNARGLLDGGADILLIETVFDTLNAKAALFAVSRLLEERCIDVPIMISATVAGESGRLLSGQTLEAFCVSVLHAKPWAIGLNCSFGAEKLLPYVRLLAQITPCRIAAYPNAGLPNQFGAYDETPERMASHIEAFLKEGLLNIVGGCCGTTPAHIAEIAKKAAAYRPRVTADIPRPACLCGLEPLAIKDGVIHTGGLVKDSEKDELVRLINDGEYEDAADVARNMVDNGTLVLDIPTDDTKALGKFLDYALMNPYITKVPFMIDSPQWETLESGLKRLQGCALARSINLRDGEDAFLRKANLVLRYGAAVVVTLIDEQGEGVTDERKVEIAQRAYTLLQKNSYPAPNIVFDVCAAPDSAVCSRIRDNCHGALLLTFT
jgi:5-methyltetrahydrofolate--homocysteine methyltransferase